MASSQGELGVGAGEKTSEGEQARHQGLCSADAGSGQGHLTKGGLSSRPSCVALGKAHDPRWSLGLLLVKWAGEVIHTSARIKS